MDNCNNNTEEVILVFNAENQYEVREPHVLRALTYSWLPSWWHKEYGMEFGEKYMFDPDYRIDICVQMQKRIAERYSGIGIGDENAEPFSVSPSFINATAVACAGGEVVYPIDNYPISIPMKREDLEKLEFPEKVEEVPPYRAVVEQVEYMNKKYGFDSRPYFWKNGVSNDILMLLDNDMFLEMMDDTPLFRKLRDYSLYIWRETLDYGMRHDSLPPRIMMPCCSAHLIGPELYEKHFLETDLKVYDKIRETGKIFFLHHCGHFDPFKDVYRKFPKIDLLQVGFSSDPVLALETFPEADVEMFLDPYFFKDETKEVVVDKINDILRKTKGYWERFSFFMCDIDAGVPDENLIALYECCRDAAKLN